MVDAVNVLSAGLRLDSWLWRARFYKTRGKAAAAIKGGAVHVNGARARTSRRVRLADQLQMTHPGGRYAITILGIPSRRGSAPEASACYRIDEHVEPEARRASISDPTASHAAPTRRPDKQARRQLRQLKGRHT